MSEDLLTEQVLCVYRFSGGVPKCWAEIESEGHKQTLGPWETARVSDFGAPDPPNRLLPESVSGYIALFKPTSKEQKYSFIAAVKKVKYPDNSKQNPRLAGFRESLAATLPDLLPPVEPKGKDLIRLRWSRQEDTEDPQQFEVGKDIPLNSFRGNTLTLEQGRHVRLWVRFLTPEEIAAAAK